MKIFCSNQLKCISNTIGIKYQYLIRCNLRQNGHVDNSLQAHSVCIAGVTFDPLGYNVIALFSQFFKVSKLAWWVLFPTSQVNRKLFSKELSPIICINLSCRYWGRLHRIKCCNLWLSCYSFVHSDFCNQKIVFF